MKTASLKEIKTELETIQPAQVLDLCIQLVKYKKENKEFLTYLLFEANSKQLYIKEVKAQIDDLFEDVNKSSVFLAKKTIRKIVRHLNKYIRFDASKQTEVELRIYFCKKMKSKAIPMPVHSVLGNLYFSQIQKINKALLSLHEDLQYDYREEMSLLV